MPAVDVADRLALPRIVGPGGPGVVDRPVVSVTTAPAGLEGEGFPVRRAFAGVDHLGSTRSCTWTRWARSTTRPGEPKGTPWHPHRGFETVTYIIDGTFRHQDSNGGGGLITNGDTQWMTAGPGSCTSRRRRRSSWSAVGCSTASSCGSTCRPGRR